MVEFGKKILNSRIEDWKEYYIDYDRLKSLIKKAVKAKKKNADGSNYNNDDTAAAAAAISILFSSADNGGGFSCYQHVTRTTVLEFRRMLDYEIQKIVLFVLVREGKLAERLYQLSKDGQLLKQKVFALVQDFRRQQFVVVQQKQQQQQQQQQQNQNQRQQINNISLTATEITTTTTATTTTNDFESDKTNAWNHLKVSTDQHREFAQDLLQFVNFVDMNLTGLRKILKKHDKNFPHHQLSGTYLQQQGSRSGGGSGSSSNDNDRTNMDNSDDGDNANYPIQHTDSHLEKLYHFGGLSALVLTLRRAFDDLYLLELHLLTLSDAAKSATQHRNHRRNASTPHPVVVSTSSSSTHYGSVDLVVGGGSSGGAIGIGSANNYNKVTPKLDNRKTSSSAAALPSSIPPRPSQSHRRGHSSIDGGHHAVASVVGVSAGGDVNINSNININSNSKTSHSQNNHNHNHDMVVLNSPSRPSHLLSTTITRKREPILDQINAARSRLRQTTKYAELVAAQALIFVDDKDKDQIPDEDKTPASEFTAVQKLSSMLNLISTFLYMTNYYIVAPSVGDYALRLGSDESMSGIIIGMTPNAALIATVLYGFWSNYSYRNALIFASFSSLCGNILYALALKYNSLNMVLMGRFFVGFGSARSINRRYIADVFSKADRTSASADFVTYAAFGMAAGPAAAFGLAHLDFDDSNLLWTDVNAPGWIMVVAWGVFLVVLVAFFVEPDRSHLYANPAAEEPSPSSSPEKMEFTVTKTNSNGSLKSREGEEESEPLLIHRGDDGSNSFETSTLKSNGKAEPPLWKNTAVMVSLWMYFVLKLVLEMLLSSSSTITKFYFSWDSKKSGLFMAVVALMMFPVNIVVAKLSQKYEDRELIVAALIVMLVSVLGIIDYLPNQYSVYQYILFGIGIFISTNSLEGVNMSLLSKTIPTSWAKGTFNSGFLATEAGTLARSVGDVLISTVAGMFGLDMLLNGLFAPMAVLCAISLIMVYFSYNQLTDMDDDDDDDDTETESLVSIESGKS